MNKMPCVDKKWNIYQPMVSGFFPTEIFFAYNETFAQSYFPLTKEESLQKDLPGKIGKKINMISLLKLQIYQTI